MNIIFVDEDEDQRETYCLTLQECFPKNENSPKVVGLAPREQVSDMRFLVEDKDTVTIILDEQLKDSGVAKYFGIDLAEYLRGLNRKIPIYILTSYPDSEELTAGEMSVEDILSKQELPTRKEVIGARILRRIDSYLDITSEREKRFESLLRKSINENLNDSEIGELLELEYLRSTPYEIDEIISQEKLARLDFLEERIENIEHGIASKK